MLYNTTKLVLYADEDWIEFAKNGFGLVKGSSLQGCYRATVFTINSFRDCFAISLSIVLAIFIDLYC